MRFTVQFDFEKLIDKDYPKAWLKENWWFEVRDLPFIPKKGTFATFHFEDFVENKEIAKYLNKQHEGLTIGEITEIVYRADSTYVYINLEPWKEEPVAFLKPKKKKKVKMKKLL